MKRTEGISEETRDRIRRRSAYTLPTRPSDEGWSADKIKKALYAFVTDGEASVISEINRIVDEENGQWQEQETVNAEVKGELERVFGTENLGTESGTVVGDVNGLREKKRDKLNAEAHSGQDAAYVQSADGKETFAPIAVDCGTGGSIVRRDKMGRGNVATPEAEGAAGERIVNVEYLLSRLEKYTTLDKLGEALEEYASKERLAKELAKRVTCDEPETFGTMRHTGDAEISGSLTAKSATVGEQSVRGSATVEGDATVRGRLYVLGTAVTEEHETLSVKDSYVVTNSDGADISAVMSGIVIRTDEEGGAYAVLYDPVTRSVRLGMGRYDGDSHRFAFAEGEGLPVAVRPQADALTGGNLLAWDSTAHALADSGINETTLEGKVDKVDSVTSSSRVYGITASGKQTVINADFQPEPNSLALRDGNGNIYVNTPADNASEHVAANKEYVDSSISSSESELKEYVDNSVSIEAGKLTPYANATFANAFKGEAHGEVIALTDVSPIKHELSMRLKSRNHIDYKNAVNGGSAEILEIKDEYIIYRPTEDGAYPGVGLFSSGRGKLRLHEPLKCGRTYTLSYTVEFIEQCQQFDFPVTSSSYLYYGTKPIIHDKSITVTGLGEYRAVFTYTLPHDVDQIWIDLNSCKAKLSELMIIEGEYTEETLPSYMPYVSDFTSVAVTRTGKNLLTYPYYHTTRTHNGITFTDNGDGSITANGTATDAATFLLRNGSSDDDEINLAIGSRYTLSGCPEGGEMDKTYKMYCGDLTSWQMAGDIGEGASFTAKYSKYYAFIRIYKGATVSGLTFYPMLELASEVSAYEPPVCDKYIPNKDGTINGVTSLYPNTSFMFDTTLATAECEYNRDSDKVYKELCNAIISLGGNI